MNDLRGKVALVTGASSGIGAAVARMLLLDEVRVAAVARRADRLQGLGAGIEGAQDRLLPIALDINDPNAPTQIIDSVMRWAGRLDILVNNAGLSRGMVLEKAAPADLRVMIETNFWALVDLTRLAIPELKAHASGDIVNIGSVAARALPSGSAVYAATKAAVGAFSESVRRELADDGVRVSVIHPGYVGSEFFDAITDPARRARTDKAMAEIGALAPEDVADLIRYVLTRPRGVNLGDITIRPTKQPV
jgi:NADP-dependent 3-hydroxy acid dehydrogenase YdfG